ncbi:putative oxidoreductase [Talaromyces proteolyticus]|uniref:D-xylose 1-dehydrogenase (NADP(+), D-xylono-1,5-lactone-forming) n=1 Tax=Talaromyces proteolyticus TaxID=1131652 RepID=A0AAD4KXS0_9EURO|nr:putative oxidoreductase [Talaromyces proteolyticus]KAH8699213.1 putative oxidoreductase [Talaromyces proteolyticus]
MLSFINRLYTGFISPPESSKVDDPVRFGVLGASFIAPMALILPAKSHPEVLVACVAARDRAKAELYAKKHGIPVVHSTYEDLINDPSISCVYIALPNSHHYEWALRAIKAGKHVLLEKPSTSNAIEAKRLFNHSKMKADDAPVLLEAFHYRFHPAWQKFLALIHKDPLAGPVKSAYSQSYLWKGFLSSDDIRLKYSLSGGCTMDFATYNISHIRQIFDDQHPQVESTNFRMVVDKGSAAREEDSNQIDEAVTATYKSKSGAQGRIVADMKTTGGWPLLPSSWTRNLPSFGWPKCVAELDEKHIYDEKIGERETHTVQRTVTMLNHLIPQIYHCIIVEDKHVIRHELQVVRSWTEKKNVKAYDWLDKSDGRQGADWWTTYRYQLEEFVNRVKGRNGSGVWIDRQDSINQMEVVDETYRKGGLEIRPTSALES